jgi:hypothetical protein
MGSYHVEPRVLVPERPPAAATVVLSIKFVGDRGMVFPLIRNDVRLDSQQPKEEA